MPTIEIRLHMSDISQLKNRIVINLGNTPTAMSYISDNDVMFVEYINRIVDQMKNDGRQRTSETYRSAGLSLSKFLGGDIALSHVSIELMTRFEQYMRKKPVSPNTSSFYMRRLRAAYNQAVNEGLTVDSRPFRTVYTGIEKTKKRAITIDEMRRICHLKLDDPQLEQARDLFFFSFYTCGMSFVDMAYLQKSDLCNGQLTYRRKKTGQQLTISWNEHIQQLVEHLGQGQGRYLLPIIKKENGKERNQMRHVQYKVNCHLKTIASIAGLHDTLTMYVARHTWASIALSLQIPVGIISQGMGHDSEKTTRIYLKQFDRTLLDQACIDIINAI